MENKDFWISIIMLFATVISALATLFSWKTAESQKNTNLAQLRIKHIILLNECWHNFNKYIVNKGYDVTVTTENECQDIIIDSMKKIIQKLKSLKVETKSIFNLTVSNIEQEFIGALEIIIPYGDWSIFHITDEYKKAENIYNNLCNKFEEFLK